VKLHTAGLAATNVPFSVNTASPTAVCSNADRSGTSNTEDTLMLGSPIAARLRGVAATPKTIHVRLLFRCSRPMSRHDFFATIIDATTRTREEVSAS
jgi:hypothetical protein